jgi:hypothetical protein
MFANRNVFHRFAFIALSISKYPQINLNETHLLFCLAAASCSITLSSCPFSLSPDGEHHTPALQRCYRSMKHRATT